MKVDNNVTYESDEDDFMPSRRSIEFTGENAEGNRKRSLCNDNALPADSTDGKKKGGKNKASAAAPSTLRDKMKAAFAKKK
mmetsp:Transcript_2154/g.5810  ORF Transcript_2154/g.5810 Transcript_2154/m.5810 type:complete len:81 (-) Transcript_2154:185-427(-)